MLTTVSKVCTDKKLSLAADHATRLPEALLAELPVIAERQTTVRTKLAEEEREQNKKLTSENISRPGFDKTVCSNVVCVCVCVLCKVCLMYPRHVQIIAKKPASSTTTAITASSSSSGKSSTKQTTIEVLNPGYKQQQEKAATKPSVSDVDLRVCYAWRGEIYVRLDTRKLIYSDAVGICMCDSDACFTQDLNAAEKKMLDEFAKLTSCKSRLGA